MAENIIIGYSVVDEDTAVVTGNEETTMPASNLATAQPTEVWQTTSTSSCWANWDLGSATEINFLGMLYTNAGSSTSIRWRGATTEANLTAAPGYDSGAVDHWPHSGLENWDRNHSLLWVSGGETYQWWRVDITGTLPDSFYRAGNVILANVHQPTDNMDYGFELAWNEEPVRTITAGGAIVARERGRGRTIEFKLRYKTKAELMANAFALDQARGLSKPVVMAIDPSESSYLHHEFIYGLIDSMGPIEYTTLNLWQKSYRVVEML